VKRLFLLSVVAIAFSSCGQSEEVKSAHVENNQLVKDRLTEALDSIQNNGLINGFAVAMVNENGVLYQDGFGLANEETKEAYTENTLQHIASVSKTLIGISLLKAQEMEKLKLDDPIQNYLPFKVSNPNFPNDPITIRHLATHTSGIQDTDQYMDHAWILTRDQDLTNVSTEYPEQRLNPPEQNVPMELFLKGYLEEGGKYFLKDNYTEFEPGARYSYSNIGATLCALVIEKAVSQPFHSFTKQYILDPLNMDQTGWSLDNVDISKHSRLYRNDNTVLPFYTAITYPDGMLISSSSDMAKYLAELIQGYLGEGTLLKKESYDQFFEEQLDENNFGERNADNPYNEDYSPALFIGHSALGYVGHSGGDAGIATWMFFDKEKKTGRYIVINCDMGNDNRARELEYYAIWDKMNDYFEKFNAHEPSVKEGVHQ